MHNESEEGVCMKHTIVRVADTGRFEVLSQLWHRIGGYAFTWTSEGTIVGQCAGFSGCQPFLP